MKTLFPHRSGSIGRLLLSGAVCALLGLVLQPTPTFPAAIPGTLVASKITAGNTLDTFSIGDTAEMGGTPKQVADITARDAITTERRTEGMTCWVIDESNEYRLVGGIANANWTLYSSITNVVTGSQFVTNDGSYLHLWGTVTNQSAPWALSSDGGLWVGTNALGGNLSPGFHVIASIAYANSNQSPAQFFDMLAADYHGLHTYGLLNGGVNYSPASATWSLLSGDNTGSTNTLAQQSHSGSAWVTASVDGTNRAQLSYLGVWEAQGFTDDSGSPGMLVAYGAAGRLVPTNAVFTSNLYSTNIYVSNVYATNITVNVITNVNNAWITNLYVSVGYITNLYVDIGYITNLYSTTAFITNLTSVTAYITNLTVQTLYSATNYLGDLTVTNGITNLSLTANTVLEADANRRISSIPNGSGALTNDNSGVVGYYPSFATQPSANAFAGSNYFGSTITTSTNLSWGPDFAVEETCLSTNAAFTFAAPVGVDTAGKTVQWTLVNVTNTTTAAVLITSPANCHTIGTPYVTNWTCVWFQCYAQKITNAFYIPVF